MCMKVIDNLNFLKNYLLNQINLILNPELDRDPPGLEVRGPKVESILNTANTWKYLGLNLGKVLDLIY